MTTAKTTRDDLTVHVIEPREGWVGLDLRELWRFRELILVFTWRNILVRYKQTLIGAGWAILQPVMLMVVFSLVFGRLANLSSEGLPYPIFAYAALLPWLFFANSLAQAATSVASGASLITKVYFPRLTMPLASVLSSLVDFAVAFIVLIGLMVYYGITPGIEVVVLPGLVLLAFITALGVGLWLSALNVRFRDITYLVPFIVQLWFFATPVVYSATLVGGVWRVFYGLNPMAGVVNGFRWALLGTGAPPGPMLLVSSLVSIATLVTGAAYFRRMEQTFADVV